MRPAKPAREGLPLNHYAARRTCRHIVRNGVVFHPRPGRDARQLVTLLEVRPGVAILTPAYNGNWDHDHEAFLCVVSDETQNAMNAVANAGGDDLASQSIRKIVMQHCGNAEAVLAYYGRLHDSRGRRVSYDQCAVIPLDLANGELIAAFRFMQRHFPGSRVTGNVYGYKEPVQ